MLQIVIHKVCGSYILYCQRLAAKVPWRQGKEPNFPLSALNALNLETLDEGASVHFKTLEDGASGHFPTQLCSTKLPQLSYFPL